MNGGVGWLDRAMGRVLPEGPTREAILGDLREERRRRSELEGPPAAHRWYALQACSIVAYAAFDRLRGHRWGRTTTSGSGIDDPRGPRGSRSRVLRDALHVLRASPGYSLAVVGTLGVAMASTVLVFTTLNGVLYSDLPYPDSDRLIRVDRVSESGPANGGVAFPDFRDWREEADAFDELAAYQGSEGVYVTEDLAEVWTGIASTPELFDVLGVPPLLGRVYMEGEGEIGSQSLILSHALWQRRFGADPDIVGRTLQFSDRSWTIHAVMPEGFSFPSPGVDYWMPLRDSGFIRNRSSGFLRTVGRLAEGVEIDAARDPFYSFVRGLDEQYGEWEHGVTLRTVSEVTTAPIRRILWIVFGAVGFFLLVACANVAGLALARMEARRRELSVRRALGASRRGIFSMLLGESCVLSLLGGAVGVLGAVGGVRALLAVAPPTLPRREAIVLDGEVLLFAFGVSLASGILFGALPGLRAARVDQEALRSGAGGGSRGSRRTHRILAGFQIALGVALLSGSGLLLRSFVELSTVETGIPAATQTLVVELGLDNRRSRTAEEILTFHRQLIDGLRGDAGIEAVGISSHLPFSPSTIVASVAREGEVHRRGEGIQLGLEIVNGEYTDAMALPILRGSGLETRGDVPDRHVLVNQTAAERLWPGEDPIGKRVSFDVEEGQASPEESFFTVVGVVPDVLDGGLDREAEPRGYYSFPDLRRYYSFVSGRFFYLVVRTADDPMSHVEAVRRTVLSLDPGVPLRTVTTMEELIADTALPARFRAWIMTVFAALAVGVALLGVYGVMSYGVASSVRDIGVRLTLGADGGRVRRRVLGGALGVALVGGALGLMAAWTLTPVLESALYGVSERDPLTFGLALVVMTLGCLVAAYLPAARASRVDPIVVLREE